MAEFRRTRCTPKVIALMLALLSLGSSRGDPALLAQDHVHIGERLTYALSWGYIPAGTAVLEVAGRQVLSGRSVIKLLHTARSNDFVSVFYPVNNRVESFLDEEAMLPTRLSFKRREGKRKNDMEVVFDQSAHLATVTKDGQTETLAVPHHVQDTLSCLYYFRSLPLSAAGDTVGMDVHHEFAQPAVVKGGLVRDEGRIAVTPEALRRWLLSSAPMMRLLWRQRVTAMQSPTC